MIDRADRAARLLAGLALVWLPCSALAADYRQMAGSTLAFASEYDGETFTGTFPDFRTTLSFDPERPQDARLDVVIPLASVDTNSTERDGTLRDAAFFAVARHPQARYTANGFRADGTGGFVTEGTLELRGVSAPVTLRMQWHPGEHPVLEARASVSRTRFGVGNGDWADTSLLPDAVAVSARVVLAAD